MVVHHVACVSLVESLPGEARKVVVTWLDPSVIRSPSEELFLAARQYPLIYRWLLNDPRPSSCQSSLAVSLKPFSSASLLKVTSSRRPPAAASVAKWESVTVFRGGSVVPFLIFLAEHYAGYKQLTILPTAAAKTAFRVVSVFIVVIPPQVQP